MFLFLQTTESEDEKMLKELNRVEVSVVKDLQKSFMHNTSTRMAHIVKAIKGIRMSIRIAQTLWIWEK